MFTKKLIFIITISLSTLLVAQRPTKDWYLRYNSADTSYGIDLQNALKNFPKPVNAKKIIVAVIDGGTDYNHEDLKANIWVNTKEIPNNSVDDDLNGYVDDIHGWDFIGGPGKDVEFDNLEKTRLLKGYIEKFGNKTKKEIAKEDRKEFAAYQALKKLHEKELNEADANFQIYKRLKNWNDLLLAEIKDENMSLKDIENFKLKTNEAILARSILLAECERNNSTPAEIFKSIKKGYDYTYQQVNYHYNLDYNPRGIVGDNYLDATQKNYGNNDAKGPDAEHGTHVAGIIGAISNNQLGNDGIAQLVEIMIVRVVPNGDERDKDVANAIRYAVDNGAKIINMSFGKGYSFNKKVVDDAVKYAESKDVLLIHAAGNDSKNNDKENNFPTPIYEDGSRCNTWIEVGASTRNQQPASFSNYGRHNVNVFAPGTDIYNSVPDNKYEWLQGTSMAGPVVAGLAALIRSYYPHLTAVQVKNVIESTVVKPTQRVYRPGKRKKTKYKKLCTSQGIVNAQNALKAAAAL